MGINAARITPTGMSLDISHDKFPKHLARRIENMRLNVSSEGSFLSWENERGLHEIEVNYSYHGRGVNINGIPFFLGNAIIGNTIVVFCKLNMRGVVHDAIIAYDMSSASPYNVFSAEILYTGSSITGELGFDERHPIETISCYENEKIQKVYWTDGINQPRVINIAADTNIRYAWKEDSFDFARRLELKETIEVDRLEDASGVFPCGVIQYAVSYYNVNSGESNVSVISDIVSVKKGRRGGNVNETSSDSYRITVKNVDSNFEYIRLYSILRTTKDATPVVRVVEDRNIESIRSMSPNSVVFYDTNTTGMDMPADILLVNGCEEIVAQTMASKENTLFLGNIRLKRRTIPDSVKQNVAGMTYIGLPKRIRVANSDRKSVYMYESQLGNRAGENRIFKYGETYRLGVQFQHETGKWSEVCPIKDWENTSRIDTKTSSGIRFTYLDNDYVESFFPSFTDVSGVIDVNELIRLGYRRYRPVVVYPSDSDRTVIAQGVLNPTVYNNAFRRSHAPDVQSSWFFRPVVASGYREEGEHRLHFKNGSRLGNIVGDHGTDANPYAIEIPSDISYLYGQNGAGTRYVDSSGHIMDNDSNWLVDSYFCTFHSPDIEFSDSVAAMDFANMNVELVGRMPVSAFHSDYSISPMLDIIVKENYSDHFTAWNNTNEYFATNDGSSIWLKGAMRVQDSLIRYSGSISAEWAINVWSRNHVGEWDRNYNHTTGGGADVPEFGKIDEKIFASMRYSYKPIYETSASVAKTTLDSSDINDMKIFDSDTDAPVILKHQGSDYIYQGNVDQICPTIEKSYDIYDAHGIKSTGNAHTYPVYSMSAPGQIFEYTLSSDMIPMKYKSSRHLVISGKRPLLPEYQDYTYSYLNIAEIRRSVVNNRFGGNTQEAYENNVWIPCGAAKDINPGLPFNVSFEDGGDHYFMRYDCLKTRPYAEGDLNQVIEIGSFLLETRINLDGRYDQMRGREDNTIVSEKNFNLINHIYEQNDNYFNYRVLKKGYEQDDFPCQFTWSGVKTLGEEIDKWCNINLANMGDADGSCGAIRKLVNFNDNMIMFQDKGVAQIPYNERTAVNSDTGTLNIAQNTGVNNIRYMTKDFGTGNKWSVCATPDNLYFIDSEGRRLMSVVGSDRNSTFESLSTVNAFDSYFRKHVPNMDTEWNPMDWNSFKVSYDKTTNDMYMFDNEGGCLAYNDTKGIGRFTSFYPGYGHSQMHAVVSGRSLLFRNGGVCFMREGAYDMDSSIEIVCNGIDGHSDADKVFNNVEMRCDLFGYSSVGNSWSTYINKKPFDHVRAWDEYQDSGEQQTDMKERFRIWRLNVPRDSSNMLDRIRNPWAVIGLKHDADDMRMLLHDFIVYYDAR